MVGAAAVEAEPWVAGKVRAVRVYFVSSVIAPHDWAYLYGQHGSASPMYSVSTCGMMEMTSQGMPASA